MKTGLTKNYRFRTIPRVGQTDAGSAGEQPARDNRPGRRNHVGVEDSSTFLKLNRFWSPLCLKKLPAEGRYYLLCVKGVCPFQAEPIHIDYDAIKYLQKLIKISMIIPAFYLGEMQLRSNI